MKTAKTESPDAVAGQVDCRVRRGDGWLRECWTAAVKGKWTVSWGDWPGRGPKRWRLVTTYAQGWCMVYLHMGPLVIGVDY